MDTMNADDLRTWLDASNLSVSAAAEQLGVSRQTVHNWLGGSVIPTTAALAVAALHAGLAPYPLPKATERASGPPAASATPSDDHSGVLAAPFSGPFGMPS